MRQTVSQPRRDTEARAAGHRIDTDEDGHGFKFIDRARMNADTLVFRPVTDEGGGTRIKSL
jgi:hypothetical protein